MQGTHVAIALALSIGLTMAPLSGGMQHVAMANDTTLYVGGSGPGNYSTIQAALDAAGDGDTVYVYSGTYRETISISCPLRLTGEHRHDTVIDGHRAGTVVHIAAEAVVDNITVTGAGGGENTAGINISADNVVLKDTVVDDSEHHAVILSAASACTLSGNELTGHRYTGVYLDRNSPSNTVTRNRIHPGISGVYAAAGGQTISYNNISNCSKGIYLEGSPGNTVIGNHLAGNQEGLFCSYAAGNTITENTFISNTRHARFIKLLRPGFLAPNRWSRNYWDDWNHVGGKIIYGAIYIPSFSLIGLFMPWIEIDWHPAAEPYPAASVGPNHT
jgi:parallel beta-helix repeat protein